MVRGSSPSDSISCQMYLNLESNSSYSDHLVVGAVDPTSTMSSCRLTMRASSSHGKVPSMSDNLHETSP